MTELEEEAKKKYSREEEEQKCVIYLFFSITTPLAHVNPLSWSSSLQTKDGPTSGTGKAAFRGADLARSGTFAF